MTLFFFNLTNGRTITDPYGEECDSLDAAEFLARQIAQDLARHKSPGEIAGTYVSVIDAQGAEVFRTPLHLAIR